jgi:uncharacterized protein YaaR (DUF327 family)
MKVREASQGARAKKTPRAAAKDSADAPGGSFFGALQGAEDRNVVERLRKLAHEITAQGEKLAEKVDIRELHVYKKMIADFLDEAVGNSRKFSKQSFLDRKGRHKVYAVIKKVNEELDELTQDLLRGEKDRIRILTRIEDIKGLILDLAM